MISFLRQCALTVAVSSFVLFALTTSAAADAAEPTSTDPTSTDKVSAVGFLDDGDRQRGQGNVSGSITQSIGGDDLFRGAGLAVLAAGSVAIYTVRRRNPNNA